MEQFDYEKSLVGNIKIGTRRSEANLFKEDQQANLKMFIEDINDNAPVFLDAGVLERGISLSEDPAVGSSLFSFQVWLYIWQSKLCILDFR